MGEIGYCSKSDLYRYLSDLRNAMNLTKRDYPLNWVDICLSIKGIKLDVVPFRTKGLRGMAVPRDKIIMLNSFRNKVEQSFDCGHEFIHILKHKHLGTQTFNCFDKVKASQNLFLEWQANEGSAELHIPYKIFIPLFCGYVKNCHDFCGYQNLKLYLAQYFGVPLAVVDLRIENLKYEISQYESGISLDNIKIKSKNQLKKEGISVVSYNTVFDFLHI